MIALTQILLPLHNAVTLYSDGKSTPLTQLGTRHARLVPTLANKNIRQILFHLAQYYIYGLPLHFSLILQALIVDTSHLKLRTHSYWPLMQVSVTFWSHHQSEQTLGNTKPTLQQKMPLSVDDQSHLKLAGTSNNRTCTICLGYVNTINTQFFLGAIACTADYLWYVNTAC